MSIAYLKVKIKSLAAEQAIIRHEEQRYRRQGRWHLKRQDFGGSAPCYATFHGLRRHRMDLRLELRAALLAYAYLRGRAYRQVEPAPHWLKKPYCKPGPNWVRVRDLVLKYGAPANTTKEALLKDLKAWHELRPAASNAA